MSRKEKLLSEGDVIELKAGHKVYVELPAHFCYANRIGVFDELATATVTIGEDHNGMSTDFLAGRYIVTRAEMEGGGTGHGPHDTYPDGLHITAERTEVKGGVGCDEVKPGLRVTFYQTGCFTAMNESVPVVGRAKKKWEVAK